MFALTFQRDPAKGNQYTVMSLRPKAYQGHSTTRATHELLQKRGITGLCRVTLLTLALRYA